MDDRRYLDMTVQELPEGLRIIDLHGEFDVAGADQVRSALAAADADGCPRVVIDLTDVPMIDSTALAVLVVAHKRLRRTGRELVVVLPDSGLSTKFQIAGLDRFFSITSSRDAALAGAPR
jgi:anti-sigma B factor antagonist